MDFIGVFEAKDMLRGLAFRPFRFLGASVAVLLAGAFAVSAEDKKPAPPPEPPKPILTVPLGLIAGRTNVVQLRGLRLKDADGVSLEGLKASVPVMVTIRKREDVKPPDGVPAPKAGDQALELEVVIPAFDPAIELGTNRLIWSVHSTNGLGSLNGIPVFHSDRLVESREPNNGFRDAQPLKPGQTVRGALEKSGEVDVFRIEGTAGQTLSAEVLASRIGSTLDGILTWYDEGGTLLASNDDAVGADPALALKLTKSGPVFLALTYANEKAGKTHGYLLTVEAKP